MFSTMCTNQIYILTYILDLYVYTLHYIHYTTLCVMNKVLKSVAVNFEILYQPLSWRVKHTLCFTSPKHNNTLSKQKNMNYTLAHGMNSVSFFTITNPRMSCSSVAPLSSSSASTAHPSLRMCPCTTKFAGQGVMSLTCRAPSMSREPVFPCGLSMTRALLGCIVSWSGCVIVSCGECMVGGCVLWVCMVKKRWKAYFAMGSTLAIPAIHAVTCTQPHNNHAHLELRKGNGKQWAPHYNRPHLHMQSIEDSRMWVCY